MLSVLIVLLSCLFAPVVSNSAGTNEIDYLAKMIACDEKDERYIGQAYDTFLVLTEGKVLAS